MLATTSNYKSLTLSPNVCKTYQDDSSGNLPPHLHINSRNTLCLRKYQSLCCWSPAFYVVHIGFRGDMTGTYFIPGLSVFPNKSVLIPVLHSVTALRYLSASRLSQHQHSIWTCIFVYIWTHGLLWHVRTFITCTWSLLFLRNIYALHSCRKCAPHFETDLWEDMSARQPRVLKQDAKSKTRLHSGCIFIGSFLRDIYVLQQLLWPYPRTSLWAPSSDVIKYLL